MSIDEYYHAMGVEHSSGCLICLPDASTVVLSRDYSRMWYVWLILSVIGLGACMAFIWEVI